MSLKYKLPEFNETKAVQIAGFFLRLAGGEMNYMKLVKLMYLVDRTALVEWGRSLTYDNIYSLKDGLILGFVLDLIKKGAVPNSENIWYKYISSPSSYEIKLIKETLTTKLSKADRRLIDSIFEQYGHLNEVDLNLFHKTLPEWKPQTSSRYTISYHEIMKIAGCSDEEIASVDDDLESLAIMDALLSDKNINMDEVLAVV